MSFGPDIKETLQEIGTSFTILRTAGNITGEYLYYKTNRQVTKPFVREHFLETAFKSDTNVVGGDVLNFVVSGDSYLVMNNTPDFFENEIIRYLAVLYKTNVLLDILSPLNVTTGYDTAFTFTTVHTSIKALIYAPLFGNVGKVDDSVGSFGLDKHELYLPIGYDLKAADRVQITGTSEYYKVDTVILRRFQNMIVANLVEYTRE